MTQKTVLHVGCGPATQEHTHHSFHGDEWKHIRVDIDPDVKPDVVDDIRYLQTQGNESHDGLYSSHNLEHLHYNDVFRALKSFHRVLKDRGRLVVVVPDFELACNWVRQGHGLKTIYSSPAGPITPFDMIFGYRPFTENNPFQQHKCGFTKDWLRGALIDAGFSGVETTTTDNFDIWGFARKIA